ncbi:MAG TPA: response regulator [Chloroflexota bacterium]
MPASDGQEDGGTLGALLQRAARAAGYDGRAAYAYLVGRLGQEVPLALLQEPLPRDWTACEALAARHSVNVALLWDLLVEDRPFDGPQSAPGTSRRVLVVEDDGPVRAMLAAVLADEGYEVRAAPTAWEGLAAVFGWRPELIVLDLVLPAVDGRALARAVRADPVLGRTPILLLSAIRPRDLPAEAARIGADAHMAKPLAAAEFLSAVARLAGAADPGP